MRVHIQQTHQKMSPTLKKPKITKPRNTKQKITKLTSTKMNLERTFNVPAEHACPQCEMSFTTCSQLKTHTIMHFKRTQCLHCSSTFSTIKTIRSYRRHAKTVHRMMEESKMKQFMELINRLKPDFERMEWTQ